MEVKDWMSPSPVTVSPRTPLVEAAYLLQRERIRHLPVVEGETLVGILTDRDLRLHLPSPVSSLTLWDVTYRLNQVTVGEVMTRAVVTVGAHRSIEAAARLMLDHRISALPVLEGGRLVGILTETDLLRALVHTLTGQPPGPRTPATAAPAGERQAGA